MSTQLSQLYSLSEFKHNYYHEKNKIKKKKKSGGGGKEALLIAWVMREGRRWEDHFLFPSLAVPTLPFTRPFPKAHPEAVSSGGILGCNERLNGAKLAKLRHWKCEFHTRPWEGWSRRCSRKFPVAGWLSSNCLPAWRHLKSSSPRERASDWSVAHLLSAGVQVLGLAGHQNQVGGSRRGNCKGRDAGQQNQTKPPAAAVHICKNSHHKNSSYFWIISIARNCVKCFISFMSHQLCEVDR